MGLKSRAATRGFDEAVVRREVTAQFQHRWAEQRAYENVVKDPGALQVFA